MTFVHSCGNLGLLLSGYVLDSRRDLRGIIEMGEPVLPWAILFHMTLDILHQIAEAFPLVFRVHVSWTSPNTRSMGLARGQYVGNQSNAKRGWYANHCSTALA